MKKISDFNNATEKYPVVYAGSASRPEYVDMPTVLQQQEGVAPIDTLPAQWWNAMWKLATRDINAFRDFVGDAFTEINNLLTKFNITLDDADSEQLYDFFHDDYVQNYLSSALTTINGDFHIKGNLNVDGIGEEIISTELNVGANTITLRNDNPTSLGNTELAGVVTENYDGNNHNNIIAIDKNGVARTGDIDIATRILYSNDGTNFFTDEDLTVPATIGATEEVRDTGNQTSGGVEIYEGITYSNNDTQPLLTRAESNALANEHMLVWDATDKKAVDGGKLLDITYTKQQVDTIAEDRGAYWGNPVGTLITFYGNVAPAHYLICDGTYIPRQYTKLIAAIGDWLPDFRECAIVGIGQNHRSIAHDTYNLGEFKDDQLQEHMHFICSESGNTGPYGSNGYLCRSIDTNAYGEVKTGGVKQEYRVGNVTRGKRMGALICIRAE